MLQVPRFVHTPLARVLLLDLTCGAVQTALGFARNFFVPAQINTEILHGHEVEEFCRALRGPVCFVVLFPLLELTLCSPAS